MTTRRDFLRFGALATVAPLVIPAAEYVRRFFPVGIDLRGPKVWRVKTQGEFNHAVHMAAGGDTVLIAGVIPGPVRIPGRKVGNGGVLVTGNPDLAHPACGADMEWYIINTQYDCDTQTLVPWGTPTKPATHRYVYDDTVSSNWFKVSS